MVGEKTPTHAVRADYPGQDAWIATGTTCDDSRYVYFRVEDTQRDKVIIMHMTPKRARRLAKAIKRAAFEA
jgi:hypothetical protein